MVLLGNEKGPVIREKCCALHSGGTRIALTFRRTWFLPGRAATVAQAAGAQEFCVSILRRGKPTKTHIVRGKEPEINPSQGNGFGTSQATIASSAQVMDNTSIAGIDHDL